MNHYPSWIQRIPEMIEALESHAADRVDRRTVGELFDLRKTAAFHLLRRFGAERCGNSLAIGRARLMARLREMQEHPDWPPITKPCVSRSRAHPGASPPTASARPRAPAHARGDGQKFCPN